MAEVNNNWGAELAAQQQMRQAENLQEYQKWETKASENKAAEKTTETADGKKVEKTEKQLMTELVKHKEKIKEEKFLKELEEKQIEQEVKSKLLARLKDQNLRDSDIDPNILKELIEDVKSGAALGYAEDPDIEADEIVAQLMSKPQDIKKLIKESSPTAEYKPEAGKEKEEA